MNESTVYLRDAMGDKKELMETIKNGNAELHDVIMDFYRNNSKMGIPLNILDYAAEHIDDFQKSARFARNVVPLFFKTGMTVEHLAYLNSYYANDPLIDISDFSILMELSLEKEKPVPLSEFKKFVSENDDDIDALSSLVMDYTADSVDDVAPTVSVCAEDENKKGIDVTVSNNNAEDVFASIINVVCRRDEKSAELALEAQNQINDTVGQIQRGATNLVSFFNRLISDKTADKEEIGRLNSVIVLLQQTLNKEKALNSDLKDQISVLEEKQREAEKIKQQRDAVLNIYTGGGNVG